MFGPRGEGQEFLRQGFGEGQTWGEAEAAGFEEGAKVFEEGFSRDRPGIREAVDGGASGDDDGVEGGAEGDEAGAVGEEERERADAVGAGADGEAGNQPRTLRRNSPDWRREGAAARTREPGQESASQRARTEVTVDLPHWRERQRRRHGAGWSRTARWRGSGWKWRADSAQVEQGGSWAGVSGMGLGTFAAAAGPEPAAGRAGVTVGGDSRGGAAISPARGRRRREHRRGRGSGGGLRRAAGFHSNPCPTGGLFRRRARSRRETRRWPGCRR